MAIWLGQVMDAAEQRLERDGLSGWDPYDALCSPLFALPGLRSSRALRYGAQQALKRSPWNLRPILRVPKQLNPVSIGLYVQGQAHRAVSDPPSIEWRRRNVQAAVERLAATVTPGYRGACWGYPFDWETRYGSVPAGTPTLVATGMIGHGLWSVHNTFGGEQSRELILSAAEFVVDDVPRIDTADGAACWTYGPGSRQAVVNATLKGSRLLVHAHALGGRDDLLCAAAGSVRFAVAQQLPSGAWPYSLSDRRADNFHTGYVLDCLRAYRRHSGDHSVDDSIERGWTYYRHGFFTADGTPKYYDDRVEPLDATACAQAIITLCEFGDIATAERVAELAVRRLALPDGSFAYQRRGGRTVRIPFLRWSTAWMYCALSRLAEVVSQTHGRQTGRHSDATGSPGAPHRSNGGARGTAAAVPAGRGVSS